MNKRIQLVLVVLFLATKLILSIQNENPCHKHFSANSACNCSFDEEQSSLIINCDSYLEQNHNIFPDITALEVVAINVFTKWPYIPESFNKTSYIHLEFNRIESIDELSNLNQLTYLNLSYNLLTRMNPDICKLKKLLALDLSFNMIQILDMQDFICGSGADLNGIMSSLRYLAVNNNKIKHLYSFDMFFIGMFWLRDFYINDNLIKYIIVDRISDQTANNLIDELNKAFHKNDSIKTEFENAIYGVMFKSLNFSNNPIELVRFNFEIIFNSFTKIASIENYFYMKFSSIELKELNCDCNFFNDLKFLLKEFFFGKKYLIFSTIFLANCRNLNNQSLINIIYEQNFNTSNCMNYTADLQEEYKIYNKSPINVTETYLNMIFIVMNILILNYFI